MSPPNKTRLPKRLRLAAGVLFWVSLWNLVRVVVLLQEQDLLADYGLQTNAQVRLLFSAAWALLFLVGTWGIWRDRAAARPAAMLIMAGYALYNLLLLALFVQSPVERQGWPARLLGYIITLLLMGWLLYRPALSQKISDFRGKK